MTSLTLGDIAYAFGDDGFPDSVSITAPDGETTQVASASFGRLTIALADGRRLAPHPAEGVEPIRGRYLEAEILEFPDIRWRAQDGAEIPEFRLSLRYEFWPGNRAFVTAFFCSNTMHAPALDEFDVKFHLALSQFETVKWSILNRPRSTSAADIQSFAKNRFLDCGDSRHADGVVVAGVNANAWRADGKSAYLEVFMEGQNSLRETADDNATDLRWTDRGDLDCTFSFLREKPCGNAPMRLWQWRNRWGWVLKYADGSRRKPPLHMYHYLDNYQRYPEDSQIEAMAANGADILVLHENWRLDLQDDGIPFRPAALARVIATAHRLGLRVMAYIRGNECGADESACEWFDRHLKRDWDGLYMDFAGPVHDCPKSESFPGGRVEFRRYFLRMRAIRERVGREGMLYGHTGATFSALAICDDLFDGYVSGEGEGGVMVDNRTAHEYFSMASAAPGTMWTGAFPAYSTARMRPFLAATGQTPHSPLGVQFQTSSLAHPQEPGLNDLAFRPVWKIWRLFRDVRDVRVVNDYNFSGAFADDRETGHYLMLSPDGNRALFVLSNFADKPRRVSPAIDFARVGFEPEGKSAFLLRPTETDPRKAAPIAPPALPADVELGPCDVAALYFDADDARAAALASDFERPYPPHTASNREHLAKLAGQKAFRSDLPAAPAWYLRAGVPSTDLPYEYSLIYDLYFNAFQLVEFEDGGTERPLGWITRTGFSKTEPGPGDYVWPDTASPWIALHDILPPGEHHLGMRSVHYGKPFYNFAWLDLSDDAEGRNARRIVFMNELEPLRQYLRWTVRLL